MTEDSFNYLSLLHIEGELSSRINARHVLHIMPILETGACSYTSLLVYALAKTHVQQSGIYNIFRGYTPGSQCGAVGRDCFRKRGVGSVKGRDWEIGKVKPPNLFAGDVSGNFYLVDKIVQ